MTSRSRPVRTARMYPRCCLFLSHHPFRTVKHFSLLLTLLLLFTLPAQAQSETPSDADANTEACEAEDFSMTADAASSTPSASSAASVVQGPDAPIKYATMVEGSKTEAEQRVEDIISQEGVHVVHFWAPWCPNSRNELGYGWDELIKNNEDVRFTFVTVWEDGQTSDADTLAAYNVPAGTITMLTQPDSKDDRIKTFLGVPMTWIPTTWIFHNEGELAFAMNYGEMDMDTIQTLINATQKEW